MRTLVAQRADALDLDEYGRLHDLLAGTAPDVVVGASVVEPGPETKKVMTKSSIESVKAIR